MSGKKIPEEVRNICDAAREAYEKELKQNETEREKALIKIVGKEFASQCVWIESENVYHICEQDFRIYYGPFASPPHLRHMEGSDYYIRTLADLGAELAFINGLKKIAEIDISQPSKPSWWQRIKESFISPPETSLKP